MGETCKKCGSANVVLVEYSLLSPEHYDGISEILCREENCGARFGRWSGVELKDDEVERVYGGQPVKIVPGSATETEGEDETEL